MNKRPIFGSLGSNYTLQFAGGALVSLVRPPSAQKTADALGSQLRRLFPEHTFGPYYFLQGRQALEATLRAWKIGTGCGVLTQAFSCFAIESSIERAGATAVYVDTAPGSTNLSVATLTKAAARATVPIKAVILQHSLGIAADELAIKTWCERQGILLISDLAQGLGGKADSTVLLGRSADAVLLSFGRDKILDGVLGGAVLFRGKPAVTAHLERSRVLSEQQPVKALCYPFITWLIRTTWSWKVGQVVLLAAVSSGFIHSPVVDASTQPEQLSAGCAALALQQLEALEKQLAHRQTIAHAYWRHLKKVSLFTQNELERSSMLRYPIAVHAAEQLIARFKKEHIYLSDRWYTRPLDSGRLETVSTYRTGECPTTEQLVVQIINLPTHLEVSVVDAERIAECVKDHLHGQL